MQRFENKYVVPEYVAVQLRDALRPFVEPDPHAAARPGFRYPIASLYLDSFDLRLYRETIEGLKNRFKLRVRAYDDAPSSPLFLEIKRRINGVIRKRRCRLPRREAYALLGGDRSVLSSMDTRTREAGEEFLGLSQRLNADPRVLVRYEREAYMALFDDRTRVTFDRRLCAAPTRSMRVEVDRTDYQPVRGGYVIVEFKFDNHVPLWIPGFVRRFDMRRRSFSKYGHAIQSTGESEWSLSV